ncbi:MAG: T9SS type A sorting domain-containing protein, partial [Chitinophagaceae bacterium]
GSAYDAYTNNSYILTSTDGVSWNAVASEDQFYMTGIATNGNRFLLSGYNGATASVDFTNSTLPVHFSGFTARLQGSQVVLDWKTALEENSDRFIVQHSTNGQDWSAITTIMAAGSSGQERTYSFIHEKPAQGTNFYRIVELDRDGRSQLTKTNKVFVGKTMQLSVYPNPAGAATTVKLPSASPSRVLLINAAGLRVRESYEQQQSVNISFEGLPAGVYQLVVVQDEQKMTRTISHH